MKYTEKQLLDVIAENGFLVYKDSDDFQIIKGGVENWLNFTSVSFKQAVLNTLNCLDPWEENAVK